MARKPSARGRGTTRRGKKNKKNLIILSLLILAMFAIGLYFLQAKSNVKPNSLAKIETKKVKPKAELPTPPEERWTYIKALETRTVVDHNSSTVMNNNQLTSEQKNILAQMEKENKPKKVVKAESMKPITESSTNLSNIVNSQGNFGLQCGAFKKYQQAESQLAKLAMLGISAHIKSNGDWHRVFVGPIGSRSQANVQLQQIGNQVNCLVIAM